MTWLGAALGGVEDGDKLRDGVVTGLRSEQQVQQEEEVRTPPRREPHGNEGHQPRGPQTKMNESVSGYLAGQRRDTAGRNRPEQRMVTGGDIGRYGVSHAAKSGGFTDRKPIFEDAENTRARAPGTTGGTYDNKGTLV